MDDAAVMNANHIINNNEIHIGTIQKSLQQANWWDTDNQMSSEQWNLIWVYTVKIHKNNYLFLTKYILYY